MQFSNSYRFRIPSLIRRSIDDPEQNRGSKNTRHNERSQEAPSHLPINSRSIASHVVDILSKPENIFCLH